MDEVGASGDDGLDLLAQTGEVGGQDAGRYAMDHGVIRIQDRGFYPFLRPLDRNGNFRRRAADARIRP
jgi:hypothetical protein